MSKKDKINQRLNNYNQYLGGLITAVIALGGFTFSAAGGVISAPKWLVMGSYIMLIFCVFALVLLQKNINKNLDELEDL